MLNFLKRIRRILLFEGNLKKYAAYALGEILLVVIGILIALAVNNGWQNRQKRMDEIEMLIEIKESLESDILDIRFNIHAHETANRCIDTILLAIEQDRIFNSHLVRYFGGTIITTKLVIRDGSYEELKLRGIELVSNKILQKAIVVLYDERYQAVSEFQSGLNLPYNVLSMFCLDHFNIVEAFSSTTDTTYLPGRMIPNDFEKLKKNTKYITLLRSMQSQNQHLIYYYRNYVYIHIEELISSLEAEIVRLEGH